MPPLSFRQAVKAVLKPWVGQTRGAAEPIKIAGPEINDFHEIP
jgi:hypothetical protein